MVCAIKGTAGDGGNHTEGNLITRSEIMFWIILAIALLPVMALSLALVYVAILIVWVKRSAACKSADEAPLALAKRICKSAGRPSGGRHKEKRQED